MKRFFFISTLALFVSLCTIAQNTNARSILDKCSAAVGNAGDIKADFTASGTQGSMSGTVYLHKNMLMLQSSTLKCWYDGKTMWTYNPKSNEVNITNPTAAEKQAINPYNFINIYKQGYTYSMRNITSGGKQCYEVTLTATNATNKIKKMIIAIDKSTYYPIIVTMQRAKGGTNTISIRNCRTKQKFADSMFKYNKSQCPNAEIIDLR